MIKWGFVTIFQACLNPFGAHKYLDMFEEYIQVALERAEYEMIDGPEPCYAYVPSLPGVWTTGKTFEECNKELISAIEGWVALGLRIGQPMSSTLKDYYIDWHID